MGAILSNKETDIQRRIMVAVSKHAAVFRAPAGLFWQGKIRNTPEYGRILTDLRAVKVLCEGFPDLVGYRRSDGKAVFIEVKTETGRVEETQQKFIKRAQQSGCLAGIARSDKDALEIIEIEIKEGKS